MQRFIWIILVCFMTINSNAQTNLTAGDIAFIGINSDGAEDLFAFVLLRDVSVGTEIKFTDNGWTAAGSFNTEYPESHITWIANSDLLAGSIEYITTDNGNQLATGTLGSISGEKMTISVAGDQVLAYQGTKVNPSFIAAISFNYNSVFAVLDFDGESATNSTTALPSSLTIGTNAIHIFHQEQQAEMDNGMYDCVLTDGEQSDLLNAICDVNNWQLDNDEALSIFPFSCAFNVSVPTTIGRDFEENQNVFVSAKQGHVKVDLTSTTACNVELYNANGIKVSEYAKPFGELQVRLETGSMPKGLYIVIVSYPNKRFESKVIL